MYYRWLWQAGPQIETTKGVAILIRKQLPYNFPILKCNNNITNVIWETVLVLGNWYCKVCHYTLGPQEVQFVICFGAEGHRLMPNYKDTHQKVDAASQAPENQWIDTYIQNSSEGLSAWNCKRGEREKMSMFNGGSTISRRQLEMWGEKLLFG